MRNPDADNIFRYVVEDDRSVPEWNQTVFYVKQLLVRHRPYLSFVDSETSHEQLRLLESCLVSWDNLRDDSGCSVEYSRKSLNRIPHRYLIEILNHVKEISTLTDRERDAIKGLVTFHVYAEEKDISTWNCEECLKKHLNAARNCQKFGTEKIENESNTDDEDDAIRVDKERVSKYALQKNKKEKKPEKGKSVVLQIGQRLFYECPLSLINDELRFLVSLVFWSNNSNTLLNRGGIMDQSNLSYEAREIVLSEEIKVRSELEKKSSKGQGGKSPVRR